MPRRAAGEGSYYDDARRKHWVGEINVLGKRRRVCMPSKTDTRAALRKLVLDLEAKTTSMTPDRKSVGSYLAVWVGSLNLAESTILRYRGLLRGHVNDTGFAAVRMCDVDPQAVTAFYRDLHNTASDSTVKKVHTLLHGAFEAARHTEQGFRNPCALPKSLKPKYRPATEAKPFDARKEAAFLKACEGNTLEALYILALDGGMRQGELFALEWRDVDFKNGSIEVRQTLTDSEEGVVVGPCKNRQRRSIKVSTPTMKALEAHRRAQAKDRIQRLVFPNANGGYMSRQNFNRRAFTEALKAAQVQSKLDFSGHSFHDLRHTTATLLLSEGESITRVSQRLGHASVTTTMNTYAHAVPQDETSPADRFALRRSRTTLASETPHETPQADLETRSEA
jgi:integrase